MYTLPESLDENVQMKNGQTTSGDFGKKIKGHYAL